MKKTVLIGATTNPERTVYHAGQMLKEFGHPIVPLGIKEGDFHGELIQTEKKHIEGVDTVSMYVSPKHQAEWKDFILGLKPKRVVFNPGTENMDLETELKKAGIEVEEACTMVLLRVGAF